MEIFVLKITLNKCVKISANKNKGLKISVLNIIIINIVIYFCHNVFKSNLLWWVVVKCDNNFYQMKW